MVARVDWYLFPLDRQFVVWDYMILQTGILQMKILWQTFNYLATDQRIRRLTLCLSHIMFHSLIERISGSVLIVSTY